MALNHKNQKSTAIYARLSGDPVRHAINEATRLIVAKTQKGNNTQSIQSSYTTLNTTISYKSIA